MCKKHVMADSEIVVIREPYIPYIPNNWNRVLVLAESQNLSSSNEGYVQHLNSLTANERMNRLGFEGDDIGVYPWDDGSLKLAYCVRGEHFCDGHWGAMIEGGQIRRLLLRLAEIGSKNT